MTAALTTIDGNLSRTSAAMARRLPLMSCGRLLILVTAITIASAEPHTIHMGYFMADDPFRAAAINLAIAQAQEDGMLTQYNFRYTAVSFLLLTTLAGKVKQSAASVRPFVSTRYLLNRLRFKLEFLRVCVDHDHSSLGIESQGHMSRSKVNIQRVWA